MYETANPNVNRFTIAHDETSELTIVVEESALISVTKWPTDKNKKVTGIGNCQTHVISRFELIGLCHEILRELEAK